MAEFKIQKDENGDPAIDINFENITENEKDILEEMIQLIPQRGVSFVIGDKHSYKLKLDDNSKPVEFDSCHYDPFRKEFYYNSQKVSNLSQKQGDIMQILGKNFERPVSKKYIMQRVWNESDYYTSRSMDVYITNLRKLFRENDIPLRITNITGKGLILQKS